MGWLQDLFRQNPTEQRIGYQRRLANTPVRAPSVPKAAVKKPSVPNMQLLFNPNYGKFGQGSGVLRPQSNPQTNNFQTLRALGLDPNPRPRASRSGGGRAPAPPTQVFPGSPGGAPGIPELGSTGGGTLGLTGGLGDISTSVDVPDENTFAENDLTYKSQREALAAALRDYEAQMGKSRQQNLADYAAKTDELGMGSINNGRFQAGPARNIFKSSLGDLENDFASRGMVTSGLYGTADSDLRNEFLRRQSDLDRATANYNSDLETEFGNFKTEQELTRQRAYADAIARRAAQYGLI